MSNKPSRWTLWVSILALFVWAPSAWLGLSFFDHHDLRHHHLPWRTWAAQEWLSGQIPFWAPIGLGFPLAAEAQTGVFYPPTMLLFMLFSPSWALNLSILLHLSLALWGMYRFVKGLGASQEASLLAAFSFAFGGLMSTHALYLGMFSAWAWLPWGLWALWERRYGLLVLSLSAMVVAGHPQAAVLGWLMIGSLGLWLYWGEWKKAYRVFGSALLAAGITGLQWVSALELSRFSLRDGGLSAADAAVGSMPIFESLSIVLPYFFGFERPSDIELSYWHRGAAYWGAGINFWELCTYVGMPILVLAVVGWRQSKLWIAVVVLSFLMMLGSSSPLWWLLHHVPPFNLLRFPVRFSIGLVMGLSILGSLGYDRLHKEPHLSLSLSKWLIFGGVGLSLFFLLSGQLWALYAESVFEWLQARYAQRELPPMPNLPPEVLAAMPPPELPNPTLRARQIVDGLSSGLSPRTHWSGLCAMVAMGFLLRLRHARHRFGGLAVVLLAELYLLGADYQAQEKEPLWQKPSESRQLMTANGLSKQERIATVLRHQPPSLDGLLLSSNLGLLYGYSDVMVPSPLRLIRHESLLARLGLGLGVQGPEAIAALEAHPELVDMMGVKYLLSTESIPSYPRLGGSVVSVYENSDRMPFAWFLSCAKHSTDPWQALDGFQPRQWVMLETPESGHSCDEPVEYIEPHVELLSSQAYQIELEVSKAGYLVLSSSWYPGWVAEVNGERQPVHRVNWTLSAVRVDSGQASVKVHYSPWWLRPVGGLMIFSVLAALGLVRRWTHVS